MTNGVRKDLSRRSVSRRLVQVFCAPTLCSPLGNIVVTSSFGVFSLIPIPRKMSILIGQRRQRMNVIGHILAPKLRCRVVRLDWVLVYHQFAVSHGHP